MKITPSQSSQPRPAPLADPVARAEVRPDQAQEVRTGARSLPPRSCRGSGSEHPLAGRIEDFADKVHERLETLARRAGLDLSRVGAAFDSNLERLMAGLQDGSLSREEFEAGVDGLLEELRGDIAASLSRGSEGPGRPDAGSVEGRLGTLAAGLEERIQALATELGGAGADGLEGALTALGGHMDRLIAGLEDGSIGRDELEKGVQSVLDLLRRDVQRGLGEQEREGDEERPVTRVEARFESFVRGVEERLSAIEATPRQEEALAKLKADFTAAMDRLGSAFFEGGSLDRGQFQELFGSLLAELRQDVQGLYRDEEAGRATLYHPARGVELLGGGPARGLDATI